MRGFALAVVAASLLGSGFTSAKERRHGLTPRRQTIHDLCQESYQSCDECYASIDVLCPDQPPLCFVGKGDYICCPDGSTCEDVNQDLSCCGAFPSSDPNQPSDITVSDIPQPSRTSKPRTYTGSGTLVHPVAATPVAPGEGCSATDSPNDCCKRGGNDLMWCAGSVGSNDGSFLCYDPQRGGECCSDGTACEKEGCCQSNGSSTIQPDQNAANAPSSEQQSSPSSNPSGPVKSSSKKKRVGAIVGGAIGGIVGLVLLIAAILFLLLLLRRRKARQATTATTSDMAERISGPTPYQPPPILAPKPIHPMPPPAADDTLPTPGPVGYGTAENSPQLAYANPIRVSQPSLAAPSPGEGMMTQSPVSPVASPVQHNAGEQPSPMQVSPGDANHPASLRPGYQG